MAKLGTSAQSYVSSLLKGAGSVADNIYQGIRTVSNNFASDSLKGLGYGIQGAQAVAATPIRVGASLADLPGVAAGKEPAKPFNVPGIGQVSTYAREAVDKQNDPNSVFSGKPILSAVSAGSHGILDTATLGLAAQGLKGSAASGPQPTKPAPAQFDTKQTLYRGEGPGNANGTHFTPDQSWAKNFGQKMYSGQLPENAKVYQLRPQDMKDAFDRGAVTEAQAYKPFFDKGYDAVVGHDAMRNSVQDVIVNPALRSSFKELVDPSRVANTHLQSAQMILDNTPQASLGANGGMGALLGRTRTNIADALDAYKLGAQAQKVRSLQFTPGMDLAGFKQAVTGALQAQ